MSQINLREEKSGGNHPNLGRKPATRLKSSSVMQLLTVTEVAELLRTSEKAIYSMVARGQIPGVVRIGRRVLFDQEVLVRWIDESRAPSPKERRA